MGSTVPGSEPLDERSVAPSPEVSGAPESSTSSDESAPALTASATPDSNEGGERDADLLEAELTQRTDPNAILAMVLGLMSVACFGFFAGIPAILVGTAARRSLATSKKTNRSDGYAWLGIALGSFGTLLSVALLAVLAVGTAANRRTAAAHGHLPQGMPLGLAQETTHSWPAGPSLEVIDLAPSDGDLHTQIRQQVSLAAKNKQTLILQTTADGCEACEQIAESLRDPVAIEAMAGIRLARINIGEFRSALRSLQMGKTSLPWFYLIDARAYPQDAISADEWDENIPENIAPVLVDFARGQLSVRRDPLGVEL